MGRKIFLCIMCCGLIGASLEIRAVSDSTKSSKSQDRTYTFKNVPALAGRTFDLTRPQDRQDFLKTLYDLPHKSLPALLAEVRPPDLHALYSDVCVTPEGKFRSLHDQWKDPVVQGIVGQIKLDKIAKSAVHPAVRLSLFSVKTDPKVLWATVEPDFTHIITGRPYQEVLQHPVFLEWLPTRPKSDWPHIEGAVGAYTLEKQQKEPVVLTGVAKTFDDGVSVWRKSYVTQGTLPKWIV